MTVSTSEADQKLVEHYSERHSWSLQCEVAVFSQPNTVIITPLESLLSHLTSAGARCQTGRFVPLTRGLTVTSRVDTKRTDMFSLSYSEGSTRNFTVTEHLVFCIVYSSCLYDCQLHKSVSSISCQSKTFQKSNVSGTSSQTDFHNFKNTVLIMKKFTNILNNKSLFSVI